MTILEAISEAFYNARNLGRLCYVVERDNGDYIITFEYQKDWLFRSYPGGRRELSIRGNELVQAAESS